VTLAVRGPSLDGTVKYWVLPDIQNRITEGSVRAFFNSSVVRIDEKSVTLQTDRGERAVENDFVLAMTGYHPDFDFLARLGVRCSDDGGRVPVHDETTYESSVPGIYVSGVMCNGTRSGVWLIENSREHARAIFDDIESKI
jgi:thioredoxin reductase